MKLSYYPGCTLKTKASNLEVAALAAMKALEVDFVELPRWNCCGAVFSLADDDLIHHLAAVRNLIRVQEQGCDTTFTLCSQCYNTLARANLLMATDSEKRDTINTFMYEEPDYLGQVEVLHMLTLLRDRLGWDAVRAKVKVPLEGLKVAPFYGCTLIRPNEVAIDEVPHGILQEFLVALGAEPVAFSAAQECCGSYQVLANPEAAGDRAGAVLAAAQHAGAEALVLSCPLCEYNLGQRQDRIVASSEGLEPVPTYYFTQLLALALGLEPQVCRLDLNGEAARKLLHEKNYIAAAAV